MDRRILRLTNWQIVDRELLCGDVKDDQVPAQGFRDVISPAPNEKSVFLRIGALIMIVV